MIGSPHENLCPMTKHVSWPSPRSESLLVSISALSNSVVYHTQTFLPLTPSFSMAKVIFALSYFSTYTLRHLPPLILTRVCHPWTFSAEANMLPTFIPTHFLDHPSFCLSFLESKLCVLSWIRTADSCLSFN